MPNPNLRFFVIGAAILTSPAAWAGLKDLEDDDFFCNTCLAFGSCAAEAAHFKKFSDVSQVWDRELGMNDCVVEELEDHVVLLGFGQGVREEYANALLYNAWYWTMNYIGDTVVDLEGFEWHMRMIFDMIYYDCVAFNMCRNDLETAPDNNYVQYHVTYNPDNQSLRFSRTMEVCPNNGISDKKNMSSNEIEDYFGTAEACVLTTFSDNAGSGVYAPYCRYKAD